MNRKTLSVSIFSTSSIILWCVIIFLPLLVLFISVISPAQEADTARLFKLLINTFILSAIIATAAVILGFIPGYMIRTTQRYQYFLLLLLLLPLVLPRYVLYYAWTLIFNPATELGRAIAERGNLSNYIWTGISTSALILWYWPLAGLLTGQGWRNINKEYLDSAALCANKSQVFRKIILPLLKGPLCLAFGICFVMSLSEFCTFHLAGIQTIGTELAVIYEMTGAESFPAIIAWSVITLAVVMAFCFTVNSRKWQQHKPVTENVKLSPGYKHWIVLLLLLTFSLIIPFILFVVSIRGRQAFAQFISLHMDDLAFSLLVAAVAAILAHIIAFGALSLERLGRIGLGLSIFMQTCIYLAMFVPASLLAVSIIKLCSFAHVPFEISQSWLIVSLGQSARLGGIALIMILLTKSSYQKQLVEMASLDSSSKYDIWRYVILPQTWPLFLGSFLLMVMLSLTELSLTMILLPAGVPNFAQRLLNQMHYARDQHVIVSCLFLIGTFVLLTSLLVVLLRVLKLRRYLGVFVLFALVFFIPGCDTSSDTAGNAKVEAIFGRTGSGNGEFMYPRAIDMAPDETFYIVDKTGRIQSFTKDGSFLTMVKMPLIEAGKPTGISFAPNGNLYVADTHYHRVMVFSPEGEIINQFGKYGKEGGCFIYPTDIAFWGEGSDAKIYVSEYGGNDKISVFDANHNFLYSFGTFGNNEGQLSRPSALCIDEKRKRLYIADACNHRIAVYDLEGNLIECFGSAGMLKSQLRYPYDLALMKNGNLIVCEYGNNRLQVFNPKGKSLGIYGIAGRQPGQLAYPWGVAVDVDGGVYVVDAGNNRIQIWRL